MSRVHATSVCAFAPACTAPTTPFNAAGVLSTTTATLARNTNACLAHAPAGRAPGHVWPVAVLLLALHRARRRACGSATELAVSNKHANKRTRYAPSWPSRSKSALSHGRRNRQCAERSCIVNSFQLVEESKQCRLHLRAVNELVERHQLRRNRLLRLAAIEYSRHNRLQPRHKLHQLLKRRML